MLIAKIKKEKFLQSQDRAADFFFNNYSTLWRTSSFE